MDGPGTKQCIRLLPFASVKSALRLQNKQVEETQQGKNSLNSLAEHFDLIVGMKEEGNVRKGRTLQSDRVARLCSYTAL